MAAFAGCGGGEEEVRSDSDAVAPQAPPPAAPADIDPASLTAQCMADSGYEVGVGNDSIDYTALDQSDPAVVDAIDACETATAETMRAASNGAHRSLDDGPVETDVDAFTAAMFACMEERGYHPTVAEPEEGVTVSGGVLVDYPPGENVGPAFAEDEAACLEGADAASR